MAIPLPELVGYLRRLKPVLKPLDNLLVVGKQHDPQVSGQGGIDLDLPALVLVKADLVLEAGEAGGAIVRTHSVCPSEVKLTCHNAAS